MRDGPPPPSRVLIGTWICERMVWPLHKRMLKERTMLESKHSFTQELPDSLNMETSLLYSETLFHNKNDQCCCVSLHLIKYAKKKKKQAKNLPSTRPWKILCRIGRHVHHLQMWNEKCVLTYINGLTKYVLCNIQTNVSLQPSSCDGIPIMRITLFFKKWTHDNIFNFDTI